MEPQSLMNALLMSAVAAGGWVLRAIYAALRELERDLSAHKQDAARTYATNVDLFRIEDKLDRILGELSRKADR